MTVDLFTFTVGNAQTVLQMELYFPNYKDVLHCDLSFINTNNNQLCYGFTQHLQGRTNTEFKSNVKLYLERDGGTASLFHVKSVWSVSVTAPLYFYKRLAVATTVTYLMQATTIGENAILLGTTQV